MQASSSGNLEAQLDRYAASAKTAGKTTDWNARLGRWSVYAAVTGAALASATSADAGMITGFAGASATRGVGAGTFSKSINFGVFPGIGTAPSNRVYGTIGLFLSHFYTHRFHSFINRTSGNAFFQLSTGAVFKTSNGMLKNFLPGQGIIYSPGPYTYLRGGSAEALARKSHFYRKFHIGLTSTHTAISNRSPHTSAFPPSPSTASPQYGIAGFALANGDLGWIQLAWMPGADGYPAWIQAGNWAIDPNPGEGLYAGTDTPITTSTPEPGTLLLTLLASGAAGIAAWRKRKTSATS
jgi:hypothetical protein